MDFNQHLTVERVTPADENEALKIIEKYADKDFSYTDATSFSMIKRLGLNLAFTFDRHLDSMNFNPERISVIPPKITNKPAAGQSLWLTLYQVTTQDPSFLVISLLLLYSIFVTNTSSISPRLSALELIALLACIISMRYSL